MSRIIFFDFSLNGLYRSAWRAGRWGWLSTAWNCVKSPVSLVMKYCPISTTFRNPASYKNYHLCCCDNFSNRSSYCCNRRFWCDGMSFSKGTSASISLRTIDCPIKTSSYPDLSWWNAYSSHIFETAPQRLSWFAETIMRKIVSNCFLEWHLKESTVFRVLCSWVYPWTIESLHGKSGIRFRRVPTTFRPRYCPRFLGDCPLP